MPYDMSFMGNSTNDLHIDRASGLSAGIEIPVRRSLDMSGKETMVSMSTAALGKSKLQGDGFICFILNMLSVNMLSRNICFTALCLCHETDPKALIERPQVSCMIH